MAEKHQTTPQHVGAYLKNLKGGPNIYKELLKAGYDDQVIPAWVYRPGREELRSAGKTDPDQAEIPVTGPLWGVSRRLSLEVLRSNQVRSSPECCQTRSCQG